MTVQCKACNEELSGDYGGKLPVDTKCPHCGEPLKRNISLHIKSGSVKLTGGVATLTVYIYPELLLSEVKELIEKNKYPLVPVIAHMACEICVERALTRAFEEKGLNDIEDAIRKLLPSRSITNDRVRRLYDALTGRDAYQDLQHVWERLRALSALRNRAAHSGYICNEEEAVTAFGTATEFVQYFKKNIV